MKYILELAYKKKLVIDRYTIRSKILFFSKSSRGKLRIYILLPIITKISLMKTFLLPSNMNPKTKLKLH